MAAIAIDIEDGQGECAQGDGRGHIQGIEKIEEGCRDQGQTKADRRLDEGTHRNDKTSQENFHRRPADGQE